MRTIPWILFFTLLAGCSPSTLEDFHKEGEARSRRLTRILEGIENREDLMKAEPVLKKEFSRLVDVIIEARTYQQDHPDEEISLEETPVSEALKEQMMRVYQMEGGREVVERAQRESLLRLDAFEKRVLPKKNQLKK